MLWVEKRKLAVINSLVLVRDGKWLHFRELAVAKSAVGLKKKKMSSTTAVQSETNVGFLPPSVPPPPMGTCKAGL